jgi:hypothetical protein
MRVRAADRTEAIPRLQFGTVKNGELKTDWEGKGKNQD